MNFYDSLKKCDMFMNRVHSTSRLTSIREAIVHAMETPEDDVPEVTEELLKLITSYCVSDTEVNTVKQILVILSELDELVIKPVDLIDRELNVLVAGHFVKYPELLAGKQIGNSVWYYEGEVYDDKPTVTSINVVQTSFNSYVGQQIEIPYTVLPATAINKTIIPSSTAPTVANVTVNQQELVLSSLSPGSTTINLHSEDDQTKTDSFTVSVLPVPASATVSLTKTTATAINETSQASATVLPANAFDKTTVTWASSAPTIASVNSSGLVTALSNGTANITAKTWNNITSTSAAFTVAVAPTSVTVTPSSAQSIVVGGTVDLNETVLPANAANKTVTWTSSAPTIASVNSSGLVTALATGTTNISAKTHNDVTSSPVAITVTPIVPTSITMTPNTAQSVMVGNTVDFNETVLPANAANKTVTWTSSAPTIASVNSTGLVTALATGTTNISAKTHNNISTTPVTVTVTPIVPTSVTTTPNTTQTIKVSETVDFNATVLPANAANKTVTWTSSTPAVASVSAAGLVTALTLGSTTITAKTHNNVTSTAVTVNVVPTPVESITLDESEVTLDIDATHQIVPTVLPADSTTKTVSYSSDSDSIATVDASGLVTAVSSGTAVITVSSTSETEVNSTLTVIVNEPAPEPEPEA